HYVKQGYGVLIVDSIQKRLPFSASAKNLLRFNGYACWLLSWIGATYGLSKLNPAWGIAVSAFAVPSAALNLIVAIGGIRTLAVLMMLIQPHRKSGTLPWNGLIAYVVTLYIWLLFAGINPVIYLVIPAFHSLQYLTVVWRYQLNAASTSNWAKGAADRS